MKQHTPAEIRAAVALFRQNQFAVENFGIASVFGDDRAMRRQFRLGRDLSPHFS